MGFNSAFKGLNTTLWSRAYKWWYSSTHD